MKDMTDWTSYSGERSSGLVRIRTFVLVAVPLTIMIGFNLTVVPARQTAALEEAAKNKALTVARLFSEYAATAMLFEDAKALDQMVQTAGSDPELSYILVLDVKGKPLANLRWDDRSGIEQRTRITGQSGGGDTWIDKSLTHASVRVIKNGQDLGTLQAGFKTDFIRAQLKEFRDTSILLTLFVLGVAAFAAFYLGKSFAQLFERLRTSMLQTAKGVDDLVNQLAAVTAEQTSAASEESTALHESNSTAADVGRAATNAAARASALIEGGSKAEEGAAHGLESVGSAIHAMRQVREQMNTIANTIGALSERAATIGEIASTVALLAERSNLLALNAAIEAARAGAQGRGFAVVAQEMRSLADGSNRSAGQVKTIIGEIQSAITRAVGDAREGERRVQNAEAQADRANENIRAFASSTREFAKLGKEIATSANEQSIAIEQMVESIGHATQAGSTQLETTKQVEETARQLRQLSKELLTVVAKRDPNTSVLVGGGSGG